MNINGREIVFVRYTVEENWIKNIPKRNWLCILVDNDRQRRYLDEIISKLIQNDVCYVCSVGNSCERTHDLIDEELTFREADIENLYLPEHSIVTNWHHDFNEGIWFAIFAAHHDKVCIDKVVILDMTGGKENERIEKLIDGYK